MTSSGHRRLNRFIDNTFIGKNHGICQLQHDIGQLHTPTTASASGAGTGSGSAIGGSKDDSDEVESEKNVVEFHIYILLSYYNSTTDVA
jgi:hypothetical protein